MGQLTLFKTRITQAIDQYWTREITRRRSASMRFFIGLVISAVSYALTAVAHDYTGTLFSSISLVAVLLITIYCGPTAGIFFALTLCLMVDYFLIPPIGSVLNTPDSREHFIVISVLALFVAIFVMSLRAALLKMLSAKQEAEAAKKEAERAKQEAEKANKHKSEFLSNMSHEIRTPITAIVGMTELMKKTGLTETQARYLANIKTSSNELLALTNDILDLSRVEAGRIELDLKSFDLADLVRELTIAFQPIAQQRGIDFRAYLNVKDSSCVLGDQNRIRQVLSNLLGNAIKFTHEGRVTLEIKVDDESDGDGGVLRTTFSVMDTGIGMPKEVCEKVFQKFTQGSTSTSRKYGGSGLGLAISKQLVELMGGSINVRSHENKGSVFYFTLQLKSAAYKPVQMPIWNGHDEPRPARIIPDNVRILLADDNKINQEIAVTILRNSGYAVDAVDNGLAAIDAVRENPYSLILMDCQMPEKDGYETSRQLREAGVQIPIIALTAHAFAEDRERCKLAGMSDYISKPFTEASLLRMVDRYVQGESSLRGRIAWQNAGSPAQILGDDTVILDTKLIRQWEEVDRKSQTGLVDKLVKSYKESAPKSLEVIKRSVVASGRQSLLREIHKLKTSTGNLGLLRVHRVLEALEGGTRTPDGDRDAVAKLEVEIESAIRELVRFQENAARAAASGPK